MCVLLLEGYCEYRLVPRFIMVYIHTLLGWDVYLCEGVYSVFTCCGGSPGEWAKPGAYLVGSWTAAIPTLEYMGLLRLLIKPRALRKPLQQSVGKSSFYVGFIRSKALEVYPFNCSLRFAGDYYSHWSLFWTIILKYIKHIAWILLPKQCIQMCISALHSPPRAPKPTD